MTLSASVWEPLEDESANGMAGHSDSNRQISLHNLSPATTTTKDICAVSMSSTFGPPPEGPPPTCSAPSRLDPLGSHLFRLTLRPPTDPVSHDDPEQWPSAILSTRWVLISQAAMDRLRCRICRFVSRFCVCDTDTLTLGSVSCTQWLLRRVLRKHSQIDKVELGWKSCAEQKKSTDCGLLSVFREWHSLCVGVFGSRSSTNENKIRPPARHTHKMVSICQQPTLSLCASGSAGKLTAQWLLSLCEEPPSPTPPSNTSAQSLAPGTNSQAACRLPHICNLGAPFVGLIPSRERQKEPCIVRPWTAWLEHVGAKQSGKEGGTFSIENIWFSNTLRSLSNQDDGQPFVISRSGTNFAVGALNMHIQWSCVALFHLLAFSSEDNRCQIVDKFETLHCPVRRQMCRLERERNAVVQVCFASEQIKLVFDVQMSWCAKWLKFDGLFIEVSQQACIDWSVRNAKKRDKMCNVQENA